MLEQWDVRELVETVETGGEPSRLLRYLPGIFADDPFLGSFLRIVDSIWLPLERQLDLLAAYFDPRLAPAELLPWLGGWLDLVLDENWPEPRRRLLLRHAVALYERRGTAGGLRDYLTIYLGVTPEIQEDGDGANPYHFTVIARVDEPETIDRERLGRIIDEEKPAHTTYTLRVEKR